MKRLISLVLTLAITAAMLPAHAAEPSEKWAAVKKQCEELGLQVTWYPEYEGLMRRYGTENMLLVEGGKSYLCKLNGDAKLAGPFDAFGEFNQDGLAPACQNGKWGMVDGNGSTVVDFVHAGQYEAELAGENYPVFQGKDGKDAPPYALFTKDGKQLTEYVYQNHDRFINGYAMVTSGGTVFDGGYVGWGFIDVNGYAVCEEKYRHDALNWYKYPTETATEYGVFGRDGCAIVCTDEGFNVINSGGRELLSTPTRKRPWRAGRGAWGFVDAASGKVGFMNENGKIIEEPQYDDPGADPKGFQQILYRNISGVEEEWLPHEGLRRFQSEADGLWGFWDEAGERTVIPALFDAAGYFDHGYASVMAGGVFGLLRNPRLNVGGTTASDKDITFTDVPAGSWFEKGVMTCVKSGVMVGTGENTFSPNATLTDAECVMLAYRLYDQAHGGDGAVMKRPEKYHYIKLTTDDGLFTHEGAGGDRSKWDTGHPTFAGGGWYLYPKNTGYIPGLSIESSVAATVTIDGVSYKGHLEQFYQGHMRPTVTAFVAETREENDLVADAAATTEVGHWWSDLGYTLEERGLLYSVFPRYYLDDWEAGRYVFAELLWSVTDLPKRFDVPPIPDVGERENSSDVYGLYEAGILGGVDAYGTFEASKTLTRAEAAVMVARILDENQRLTAPPRPMPTEEEGYTLTYLRDGVFGDMYRLNDTYPYCVVGEYEEGSSFASTVGLLTLDGEYTPWSEEMEEKVKVPYGWRNWGGLDTESSGGRYYRWSDGTPATEKFDFCGKIGPDGRGFVQKDGKLYRIQFDLASEKAVVRPERPTVPPDAAEGTESLYDFNFYDRYGAKVDQQFGLGFYDEEGKMGGEYTLFMPIEGVLEGAVAESIDGDGLTPYQLKRYKQDSPDGTLVVGVHAYPLDGVEYISYLWTDRPGMWVLYWSGLEVGTSEEDLVWRYSDLRLIEKEEAELDWMSSHSDWDFDELYVWQPFTLENNDCRDVTFYMKDHKVAAIEMTAPLELRYVYGHDKDAELQRAKERRQAAGY